MFLSIMVLQGLCISVILSVMMLQGLCILVFLSVYPSVFIYNDARNCVSQCFFICNDVAGIVYPSVFIYLMVLL